MTLTPTQRLLFDIYATDGPTVRLEGRLDDSGAIEGLSVLVYDRTLSQVLHLPLPLDPAGATVAEVSAAAQLWCTLLEGNGSDCRHR